MHLAGRMIQHLNGAIYVFRHKGVLAGFDRLLTVVKRIAFERAEYLILAHDLTGVHPQIANFCVARGDWAQPGSLS